MKIIHLSDLHLSFDGSSVWGQDTRQKLLRALKQIELLGDIDVLIVSGDLSDDGSLSSYCFADQAFSRINIPTYWCPGNHDKLDVLLQRFRPSFCRLDEQVAISGWRIYLLNSVVPIPEEPRRNRSRGIISKDTWEQLSTQLSLHPEPSIVVLHHPPLELGGWQDERILENRLVFREQLKSHSNVRLVLSGHVHCYSQREEDGIIYCTAPSLGFSYDKELPKYNIQPGLEGYNCITIDNGQISIEYLRLDLQD